MYSEQLERLIQVCLADGVITEKEREVICKKAKSLGVDEDEVMVYVDGLLAEMQSKKKSSKEGEKHTCPNCGANIPAMVGKCPECGFEIRDNRASNAVSKFAEQYQSANLEKQIKLVQSFPVPNNKEDLIEFASMAIPLAKGNSKPSFWKRFLILWGVVAALSYFTAFVTRDADDGWGITWIGIFGTIALAVMHGLTNLNRKHLFFENKAENDRKTEKQLTEELGNAWAAKSKQVLLKAKIFSANDPKFASEMSVLSKEFIQKERRPIIIIAVIWLVAIIMGALAITHLPEDNERDSYWDSDDNSYWDSENSATDSLNEALDTITEGINMPEDN